MYQGQLTRHGHRRGYLWSCAVLLLASACDSSDGTTPSPEAAGTTVTNPSTVSADTVGTTSAPGISGTGGTTTPEVTGSQAGQVADPSAAGGGVSTDVEGAGGPDTITGSPAAGSGIEADAWQLMAYDLASTYHNPAESTITRENAANLEILWRKGMGGNVYGAPLQVGDAIYASSPEVIQAFAASTGEQLWRNTRDGTQGSMAYSDGMLYMHEPSSEVVALQAETGEEAWRATAGPTMGDGLSSPIITGDTLLIGGSGGAQEIGVGGFRGWLAAHDKNTGAMLWSTHTVPENAQGAAIWSTVAVDAAAGLVYAGTGNNHGPPATDTSDAVIAFDLGSGEIKWKNQRTADDTWALLRDPTPPDADFGANPVLYSAMLDGQLTEMIAASQKSGDAHGLRRADGEVVWTRSLCPGSADGSRGVFVNTSWVGSGLVVACNTTPRSTLYGLDAATGEIQWETPLDGLVYGRISSIPGVGFVGAGTELVIFDTANGEILKKIPAVRGTVTGTITIAKGRVAYGEGMSWGSAIPGETLTVLALP